MRLMILFALAALAACGPAAAPAPETPAPVEASQTPPDASASGPFTAISTTAMSITGDMSFSDAAISFVNGIDLRTTHLATGAAFDRMNANGDTFAAAAPGADDRVVDLRRVDAQEAAGAPQGGLCGDTTPTYVALVHDLPITSVAVIAFGGADPPGAGAGAAASAICAVYSYAK